MSKVSVIALGAISILAVMVFSAAPVRADAIDGYGFYVRPSRDIELGDTPVQWQSFPISQTPSPPPQEDILLTPEDPLSVLVPMFYSGGTIGLFDTRWSLSGSTIEINAYFFLGGVTNGISGPGQYIQTIGQLPAGEYTLEINCFRGFASSSGFDDVLGRQFLASPAAFLLAHPEIPYYDSTDLIVTGPAGSIYHDSLTFTVTAAPEPASLALLLAGAGTILRRRRK